MKKTLSLIYKPTCLLGISLLLSTFCVNAQQIEQVLPNGYASTQATRSIATPLHEKPKAYQMLIAENQLVELVGKQLKSIAFRLPSNVGSAWPASDVTFNDYKIYLGKAVDPANRSLTYSANTVGELSQVKAGKLLIPAESFPVGGSPNAFGFEITFDTPWKYSGGNLLIEIQHSGSGVASRSVEGSGTPNDPSYGTHFAAIWGDIENTGQTKDATFGVIKIKAEDSLGNEYATLVNDGVSTYPNPTSNKVFIKSRSNIKALSLYNTAGQLVLNKVIDNNAKEYDLNISNLSNGAYILKIKTNDSVKTKKIIKK